VKGGGFRVQGIGLGPRVVSSGLPAPECSERVYEPGGTRNRPPGMARQACARHLECRV
jgi:hypothetical protein